MPPGRQPVLPMSGWTDATPDSYMAGGADVHVSHIDGRVLVRFTPRQIVFLGITRDKC